MKNKITKHQLYKRQTTLSEFGELSQQKLSASKVVIIGCGGLGSIAAVYLSSSGIGRIHLIDYDVVEISNLHRQVFYKTDDIGELKSRVLAEHIKSITPFSQVTFSTEAVTKKNIFESIDDFDVVVDCTDNLAIKYLINDACVISKKVLVYGSLYKFDGYIATFNYTDQNGRTSSNLRDAFPILPKNKIPNCSEAGTLNTIVGIIGLMQANEVIKVITSIGELLIDKLMIFNSLSNSSYRMILNTSIPKKEIQSIFEFETYSGISCLNEDEDLLISIEEFKNKILNREKIKVLSVIENKETILPFEVDIKIPLSVFNPGKLPIEKDKIYIVVCNRGISSYIATEKIKKDFPNLKVFSLKNGIINY